MRLLSRWFARLRGRITGGVASARAAGEDPLPLVPLAPLLAPTPGTNLDDAARSLVVNLLYDEVTELDRRRMADQAGRAPARDLLIQAAGSVVVFCLVIAFLALNTPLFPQYQHLLPH